MGGAREAHQLNRRLGLSIPAGPVPVAELPAAVRRAEELGWTDAWSFEVNLLDAFAPLAAAAAVTREMRLGTAIVPVYLRPVGLLAMQAAGVAGLAPGRFVLGLGSSTPVVVEQWMGVRFERPRTRVLEAMRAARALLAGERVGGMRLGMPPPEPVPVWMAALGGRMLESAAAEADGLCLYLAGPRYIAQLLAESGRSPFDSMCRIGVIPGPEATARASARRQLTAYAIVPYYARSLARQGFGDEVRAVTERWAAGDRAGAAGQVSDAMVDELVLVGDDDRIADGLARYWEAGLGCPVLDIRPVGEDGRAEFDRLLEALPKLD